MGNHHSKNQVMKNLLLSILLVCCTLAYCQQYELISTLDFVQFINGNTEETHFYHQNNRIKLREAALEMVYIHCYEILETVPNDEAPFHLILVTTYANSNTYKKREDLFGELIEQKGELKLLNGKKPTEFRKNVYNKEMVGHWNTKVKS